MNKKQLHSDFAISMKTNKLMHSKIRCLQFSSGELINLMLAHNMLCV